MMHDEDPESKDAILAQDPSYSQAFQIFNPWLMMNNTGI
jgi:hypothetical protein